MNAPTERALVALTMGDVAGIGPEVIARAWSDSRLHALARPLVIGDPAVLMRALRLVGAENKTRIDVVTAPEDADPGPEVIPCLAVAVEGVDLTEVAPGVVDPRAGRAAYEYLTTAASLAIDRPHRRNHHAALEQAGPPPERRPSPRSHRDPRGILRRGRPCNDAVPGNTRCRHACVAGTSRPG